MDAEAVERAVRRIAHEVLERARERGTAREIRASYVPIEGGAGPFYRKLGFVDTGQRRNYYGHGEDAVIMSLTLRPGESSLPGD